MRNNELAALIDHTNLKADASEADIEKLCQEAMQFGFAAVCIRPEHVARASALLAGSSVSVACVANFPTGDLPLSEVLAELGLAIAAGADEVDCVMDLPAALSGDWAKVTESIEAVTECAHAAGLKIKLIIETALLSDDQKVKACQIAHVCRVDFVKTSTGYGPAGATTADVALMRATVGDTMGVKAAGGINNRDFAEALVAAGANRLGTSHALAIISDAS